MLRGLYIAGAGMDANQARAEALAHNLANLSTPGYKRDVVAFAPYLTHAVTRQDGASTPIGQTDYGVAVDLFTPDLGAGPLKFTGRPTDIALEGEGFFAVETAGGEEAYTRDGQLTVDPEGYLVTAAGDRVLGEGGPVQVTGAFTLNEAGEVIDAAGEVVDRLRVTTFTDPGALTRDGAGRFLAPAAAGGEDAQNFRVLPGTLEAANVDLAVEMAGMIKATRAYEAAQRLVRAHDQLAERAISQVGGVR
ncbi:MAG: flagellar hook-basal body protein [Thermoanaerobacterales bacterium]|nr:flagellar hook-basal body protein [Bacillota bacterium]MDI6906119.1 flagellar hook-basal body protein [Thermoanaerobacterales bacterium]